MLSVVTLFLSMAACGPAEIEGTPTGEANAQAPLRMRSEWTILPAPSVLPKGAATYRAVVVNADGDVCAEEDPTLCAPSSSLYRACTKTRHGQEDICCTWDEGGKNLYCWGPDDPPGPPIPNGGI
jgi:hypothetical protein